jgi:hypothetical protein
MEREQGFDAWKESKDLMQFMQHHVVQINLPSLQLSLIDLLDL